MLASSHSSVRRPSSLLRLSRLVSARNVTFRPVADTRFPRQTLSMRVIAWMVVGSLLGCAENPPDPHWNYHPPRGQGQASLDYDFADSEGTVFIGVCEGRPSFILAGGNWELGAEQFTLTVDGHSWTLPTIQSVHGHRLPVDRQIQQQAIFNAKQLIGFRVGKWHREIRPAAPLRSFVTDCS